MIWSWTWNLNFIQFHRKHPFVDQKSAKQNNNNEKRQKSETQTVISKELTERRQDKEELPLASNVSSHTEFKLLVLTQTVLTKKQKQN